MVRSKQHEGRAEKRRILYLASEMMPLVKTGGLADVAGALPKALKELKHDVCALLPKYEAIERGKWRTRVVFKSFPVRLGNTVYKVGIERCYAITGIELYLLDYPAFYHRPHLYGYHDDALRFALLCRTALELSKAICFQPDVIHCNDWQTGLVPAYLNTTNLHDGFFLRTATVFTIHNLGYQGNFTPALLSDVGLPWETFSIEGVEFYGHFSFMKAGLYYSDMLTTVSPRYAQEIQTKEFGEGFHGLLSTRSNELVGILNGVDYDFWNPKTDKMIPVNYDASTVDMKRKNKAHLQEQLGLPVDEQKPVIGIVSRLAWQKGFDLLIEAADELLSKHDLQLVILGAGEERYESAFIDLAKAYPTKVGARIGVYDEPLAHLIYAGSDMFLMPSRYEPCGLGQMISLRYGTLPIVHYTGGLIDTVKEVDEETGNGFGFHKFEAREMLSAIEKALSIYNNKPQLWRKAMLNAMGCDYSWKHSASEYERIYEMAIQRRINKLGVE
ncbi:MAG: glycogen synthase GlgA [Armatimonadota bacterium]|nr:glycogen synthase GlgA [Armatimonadota bacterium]MCX7777637.1 glycogen synthase GlgA [Armatimonadota bacterium]MDW8025883.1 glycogen synthase GlgA [Armatimonadota bacterium]